MSSPPSGSVPAKPTSLIDKLFEKGKRLPAGKLKELVAEEKNMRERIASDPAKKEYYALLYAKLLCSEKDSDLLSEK